MRGFQLLQWALLDSNQRPPACKECSKVPDSGDFRVEYGPFARSCPVRRRSITVLNRSARCNRDAKRVGLLTSYLNLRPAQDPNTRAGLVHLRPCTRASIPNRTVVNHPDERTSRRCASSASYGDCARRRARDGFVSMVATLPEDSSTRQPSVPRVARYSYR